LPAKRGFRPPPSYGPPVSPPPPKYHPPRSGCQWARSAGSRARSAGSRARSAGMRAGSARLVAVDLKELGAPRAAHIDRNHPRLGSALLGLRWGGLRTIEPDRTVWGLIVASGVGLGLAA